MPITRRHALFTAAVLLAAACASPAPVSDPAPAWNPEALAKVVAYVGEQNSTGLVITQNGHTIAEQYWPLPDSAAQFKANFTHGTNADGVLLEDVASQQKSFIAILVGVAVDNNLLDVSQTVSSHIGDGWSKAPPATEAKITILNLLEMNSGLNEQLETEAAPGETFFYNTPAYAILKNVLEAAADQPLDKLTADWLTAPAGMTDTAWRQRPAVFAASGNPTGLVTTPRDIAIMGQLVLDDGRAADGTRVISKAQLDAMFIRSATNPAYGRLWWLNGGDHRYAPGPANRMDGPLIDTAPTDLVAALGAMDRKLFVVPSLNLVVARNGMTTDRDFNDKLWGLIMNAVPD